MAELDPTLLMVYAGLFGAVLGSFLNVVIHRLPRQLEAETQAWLREQTGQPRLETKPYNLAWPASHCPQCERPLPWFHNLPVLSWLALRGRSACCDTPIARRYPLVEGLMALLTMGLVQRFGVGPEAGALIILTGFLLALGAIDAEWQLLPDPLTLPLLWLGLLGAIAGLTPAPTVESAVLGAALGYLSLWSLYWGHRLLTKREGMGYGDFKLLAAGGAWLGWMALPQVALLAAASGLVFALTAKLRGRLAPQEPLPFGPFLATAIWLTAFFGVR